MSLPVNVQRVWVGAALFLDSNGVPLVGKKLTVTPTTKRITDAGAGAVIVETPATGTVASDGSCWVKSIATDDPDLNPDQFTLAISEPGGSGYFIFAPATGAPSQTHSDIAGSATLPTIDLSTAVQKAPAPLSGQVQVLAGRGITSAAITSGRLIITYDDGSTQDAGAIAGSGAVSSVNTQTGTVVLTAANVSAIATSAKGAANGVAPLDSSSKVPTANLPTFTSAVTSVNTHTGTVVLAASDVGAVATTAVGADNGVAPLDAGGFVPSANLPSISGAVSSVNTLTGDVVLTTGNTGFVATTDSRLGYLYTARAFNVRNTGNPLADAVMDGSSHALSTRFGSLGAAQAVFPACTALTEEIDYYAIQTAINNHSVVYLSSGTAVLHKALLFAAGGGQTIFGDGPGATTLFLKSGSNTNMISPADTTNANPNMTFRGFTLDGNAAGNTGTIGQTDNLLLYRCDNLRLENLESKNANGRGIHAQSVTGTVTQVQHWSNIYCHDNLHWGIWTTNGIRKVQYVNITCDFNGLRTDISLSGTGNAADTFTGGMLLDHSESSGYNIQCHNNGQDGLWIRNVFACNISGVRATQNGRHGVRVLGLVDSIASDWFAAGNGANLSLTGHDIWFDGTGTLNYGVTGGNTVMSNIAAGPSHAASIATQGSWAGNEDYAIYFDDNMSASTADITATMVPGTAGTVRFPTTGLGSLTFEDGSGLEKVNNVLATGTTEVLPDINVATMHRLTLTANCDITLPPPGLGKVITVNLIQPATGGPFTPTFHPADGVAGHMKYPDGNTVPTWTTAAGSADRISWVCDDGVHWVGFISGQNI